MAGVPTGSVLEIIENRLIPNEEAKRARGEVFTPLNLVRELLFGVRKEKPSEVWGVDAQGELFDDPAERIGGIPLEIWRNPESKFLDPANGIGNFPCVAFQMLDFKLKDKLKDMTARRKHIVEKMLFMIEIDKGNVNTSINIFRQLSPDATANICCADTLKLTDADLVKEFGVSKFDVVMGNPPFQAPIVVRTGSAGHETIWDDFVRYSLNILNEKGTLVFITPPPWRKPENSLWDTLAKKRQMVYIHIFGERAVSSMFHVAARVDGYVLENTPKYKNTDIIDENGKYISINTDEWSFLPNYTYDDMSKIVTTKDAGIPMLFNSFYDSRKPYISKTRQGDFDHPVVHGITQKGLTLLYTRDTSKGHFGVPKVLLNMNRNQYPVNDFEGKYGMSQYTFAIPIQTKEEGDLIVRAINTDRFKEIIKATKWGAFQTEYKMFKYFKPDFYKEFLPKEGGSRRRTRRGKRHGTTRRAL
jgi:hypothetical protein